MLHAIPTTPLENFVHMVETLVPDAEVQLDGNDAVIPVAGDDELYLIHDGGIWRVHAGRQTAHWTPDQREERVGAIERLAGAMEQALLLHEHRQRL
jgi:hypothetical protein